MIRSLRRLAPALLCAFAGFLCAACGSPGSNLAASSDAAAKPTGTPARVQYIVYSNGQRLGLVNESHTSRQALSEKRKLADAGTKVTTDEIMSAVLDFFDDQSLLEAAAPGAAPATGPSGVTQAIEVDVGGRVQHVVLSRALSNQQRQAFLTCAKAFADVYNATYALQAVDEPPDFEASGTSAKKKPPVKEP